MVGVAVINNTFAMAFTFIASFWIDSGMENCFIVLGVLGLLVTGVCPWLSSGSVRACGRGTGTRRLSRYATVFRGRFLRAFPNRSNRSKQQRRHAIHTRNSDTQSRCAIYRIDIDERHCSALTIQTWNISSTRYFFILAFDVQCNWQPEDCCCNELVGRRDHARFSRQSLW
jgi:hypothetical protein